MGKVCRYDNCNNEYNFNFWGEQSLEDMLAIIDHMTINANGRYHCHDERSHKTYEEIEDDPRP